MTMIYAEIDPAKRKLTFASAGHLPPLFVGSSGARFLKADAGLPLGIMECEFSEHEIEMPAGSRIFLYSDGLTEAVNSSQEENDVDKFTTRYPKSDDVTVVMIARLARK